MHPHLRRTLFASAWIAAFALPILVQAEGPDTDAIECDNCAEWNTPQAPFRLHGRSWYVGVRGLSVVVISTDKGLILLDGGLPQSVPLIQANLEAIGFKLSDVRYILNSHAHYDHAGGIAALQRLSGAKVVAAPLGAAALRRGDVLTEDPQAGFGDEMRFAPVFDVEEIADGGAIELGELKLTAHYTPGHTPGGVSWSWRSCDKSDCVDMVFGDSLNAVSAPEFKFTADGEHGQRIAEFQHSIETVKALRCDLLVPVHPNMTDLFERLADASTANDPRRFVDGEACAKYASAAGERLQKRVAEELGAKTADTRG